MKQCISCGKPINDNDKFCTCCGAEQKAADAADNSLFLKYAGYLDNEALFKVAWAKEKGLIKSDFPNEAETIYQMLALKGHLESMYRYALLLLAKNDSNERNNAEKWLKLAANQGHVASRNYLDMVFSAQPVAQPAQADSPQLVKTDVPAPTLTREPVPETDAAVPHGILSGEAIFGKMSGSVIEILATTDRTNVACASGFAVSSNGFFITNAHAVLDESGDVYQTIHAKTENGEYEALPVAIGRPASSGSNSVDLALLYVHELAGAKPADLGNSDTCENGQKVYLIGNSLGDGICITSGIISDKHRKVDGLSYPYIMTDAAANHGNSGGPLLNERGETIGVLVAGIEAAEGMNFAIPMNVVKEFLTYVVQKANWSSSQCAELAPLRYENKNMAFHWDNIFSGIHIIVDVIALLMKIL